MQAFTGKHTSVYNEAVEGYIEDAYVDCEKVDFEVILNGLASMATNTGAKRDVQFEEAASARVP